jgi:5-methylcytosine-specific restriction endonuclease McrA
MSGLAFPKSRPSALSKMDRRASEQTVLKRNSKAARERDGRRCRLCGSHMSLETHHLVPRSLAGRKVKHERSNLVTACLSCHGEITRRVVRLEAMTHQGADGLLRVSKWSDREMGYVVVTEKA